MPTAFTAMIGEENATFNEFVWACARGFGALLCMRDDRGDSPIPLKLESNGYYESALQNAKTELEELQAKPDSYFESLSVKEAVDSPLELQHRELKRQELLKKYESALKDVVEWQVPSQEHVKLKEFMLNQLKESITYDCVLQRVKSKDEPVTLSASDIKAMRVKSARSSVQYYERLVKENVESIDGCNLWLKGLQDSVGLPPQWVASRKVLHVSHRTKVLSFH